MLTDCDRSLRSELDEAKSEIAVTGCVRENLVELERQKTSVETELETMRQLLTESHDESTVARTVAEHELAKTQVGVHLGEVSAAVAGLLRFCDTVKEWPKCHNNRLSHYPVISR